MWRAESLIHLFKFRSVTTDTYFSNIPFENFKFVILHIGSLSQDNSEECLFNTIMHTKTFERTDVQKILKENHKFAIIVISHRRQGNFKCNRIRRIEMTNKTFIENCNLFHVNYDLHVSDEAPNDNFLGSVFKFVA